MHSGYRNICLPLGRGDISLICSGHVKHIILVILSFLGFLGIGHIMPPNLRKHRNDGMTKSIFS